MGLFHDRGKIGVVDLPVSFLTVSFNREGPIDRPNELRLFISSTFRDMQEEREHLVRKIFPEIRALCRKKGITFTEIDLRWGVTEESAMNGEVIRTCLDEVDKCRPYFIGLLGSRYGWVPELHDVLIDPELTARYPWVEEATLARKSVTEMEFIHGVFSATAERESNVFFYHRTVENAGGESAEADDPEALSRLVEQARSSDHPFRAFASVDHLGEVVRNDLVTMIAQTWPEETPPTPLERERRSHEAFAASRRRAYIPDPRYHNLIGEVMEKREGPTVLVGPSGLGKSSLVADRVARFRREHPDGPAVAHYVGISDRGGSAIAIVRRIIAEIASAFDLPVELPESTSDLRQTFTSWLHRTARLAEQRGTPVLIAIDALDRLDDKSQRLTWLPTTVPAPVRLLLSTTPGPTAALLNDRGWKGVTIEPLENEAIRRSIVVRYLGEFNKRVAPDQLRQIVDDPKASSPLFLRVAAEELRLHGMFETIDDEISRIVGVDDLDGLFDLLLERIDHDFGRKEVALLLSMIDLAESGLSEQELLDLSGLPRLDLSRILFAFDYHLTARDGRLLFFHDYLRRAVERRYLSETSTVDRIRRRVVDYFRSIPPTERSVREEFAGLRRLDDRSGISTLLFDIDRFALLATDETVYEVRSALRELQASGLDLAQEYPPRVEEYARSDRRGEEIFDHLLRLGDQLLKIGCDAGAAPVVEILDRLSSSIGDQRRRARNLLLASTIAHRRQEYDSALELGRESFEIYSSLGDRIGASNALRHRGGIDLEQGRLEEARATLQEASALFRELGDRSGVAMMAMNIGVIHARQGALDKAAAEYRRGLEIVEEIGDVTMIARTTLNIGSVHFMQQEFDEALARYKEGLELFRQLDERVQVASALSNIGNVHFVRDEYQTALELYGEALVLMKETDERHEEARLLSNMGQCSIFLGRDEPAVDYLLRSIRLKRQEKSLYSRVQVSSGLARILLRIAEEAEQMPTSLVTHFPDLASTEAPDRWRHTLRRHAREFAEECLEEAEASDSRLHVFAASILRARIDAADGDQAGGSAAIVRLRDSSNDEEEQAECGYWLWKIDPTRVEDRHDAFLRYGRLMKQENPDVDIRRHFAELEAAERIDHA